MTLRLSNVLFVLVISVWIVTRPTAVTWADLLLAFQWALRLSLVVGLMATLVVHLRWHLTGAAPANQ